MWLTRDANGEMLRRTIVLRDTGTVGRLEALQPRYADCPVTRTSWCPPRRSRRRARPTSGAAPGDPRSQRGCVRNLPQYPVPFRRAVWGTALAVATFASAPPALGGQGLDPTMPLPPGTTREKGRRRIRRGGRPIRPGVPLRRSHRNAAGVVPAAHDPGARWRAGHRRFAAGRGTQVSSHVTEHSFVDECADSGASVRPDSATPPPCKKWRRGLDKKRALQNSRLGLRDGERGSSGSP